MSQEQNRETIIARIKKLLKHAASAKEIGSLQEAEAFTAKANELLLEYNLEISQIKLEEGEDEFAQWMYAESISYKNNQSGDRWLLKLIGVLTKHNLCSYTYNSHFKTFRVYGRMENVDSVVWLYNFLSTGLLRLAQQAHVNRTMDEKIFYGNNRYSFLKDWLIGAVTGFDAKLEAQRQAAAKASQMNALMVINKDALNRYADTKIANLKPGRKSKPIYVGSAYEKGYEVGRNYSINKPLTAAKSTTKMLN